MYQLSALSRHACGLSTFDFRLFLKSAANLVLFFELRKFLSQKATYLSSPSSPLRSCLVLAAVSASPVLSLLSSPRGCFREPPYPPASFLHSIDHAWAIKDAGFQAPSRLLTSLPYPPRLADFSKKRPSPLHISKNCCTFARKTCKNEEVSTSPRTKDEEHGGVYKHYISLNNTEYDIPKQLQYPIQ